MQHRYVGDVGDYVKLALLRALSVAEGSSPLGVIWCLVPDESHNKDGKHIAYLQSPAEWRTLDAPLFDHLKETVTSESRRLDRIEQSQLFERFRFFSEMIPISSDWSDRGRVRDEWLQRAKKQMEQCSLIFVDPDNGLASEYRKPTHKQSNKSVFLDELVALRADSKSRNRTLLVYQHQTRRLGGHYEEIRSLAKRLKSVGFRSIDVLRAKRFSPRVFLLLDADDSMREIARQFSLRWSAHVEWNPHLSTPS
jgi:hypothetical protein